MAFDDLSGSDEGVRMNQRNLLPPTSGYSDQPLDTTAAPRTISRTYITQLVDIIEHVRLSGTGLSRTALSERLSLGRNALEQRLRMAVDADLLISGGHGVSTGGRAPQVWKFNPQAGTTLVACVSYKSAEVALTHLDGSVIDRRSLSIGILDSPHLVCETIVDSCRILMKENPTTTTPWGMGLTLPVPVDFRTGKIVDPISEPNKRTNDWPLFPIRRFLTAALKLPIWIEDEVNAMALTASVRTGAPRDLLYVRLSLGLGLGIVSGGKVHRGALGISGEIAHLQVDSHSAITCRCGRKGCLETFVSGTAFERIAANPTTIRKSPYLSRASDRGHPIAADDVFRGIHDSDKECLKIADDASVRLARVLSVLATTYNPGEIVIGGTVTQSGHIFATRVNEEIRRRVLPTTSARLSVRMGGPAQLDEIAGATRIVVDALLSMPFFSEWIERGTPVGCEDLLRHKRQDA